MHLKIKHAGVLQPRNDKREASAFFTVSFVWLLVGTTKDSCSSLLYFREELVKKEHGNTSALTSHQQFVYVHTSTWNNALIPVNVSMYVELSQLWLQSAPAMLALALAASHHNVFCAFRHSTECGSSAFQKQPLKKLILLCIGKITKTFIN